MASRAPRVAAKPTLILISRPPTCRLRDAFARCWLECIGSKVDDADITVAVPALESLESGNLGECFWFQNVLNRISCGGRNAVQNMVLHKNGKAS